jgi:membrane protein
MAFKFKRLDGKLALLPTFAAAMAFYFVVSLVPVFIVVSKAVAWIFSANLTPELASFLRDVLPPESRLRPEAITAAVQGGTGIGAVSTLIAVWTAANGLNEMARAVHYVFSDANKPHPGGWVRRLKSFGLLFVWTVAIVTTAVFLVLLPAIVASVSSAGSSVALRGMLAADVRYPVALGLMFVAFTMTYSFIPEQPHRPTWRAAAEGGVVATACWLATCVLFAYLLPRVWGLSLFRGVLSSALATLVWAYCGCWGVLIGACWSAASQ